MAQGIKKIVDAKLDTQVGLQGPYGGKNQFLEAVLWIPVTGTHTHTRTHTEIYTHALKCNTNIKIITSTYFGLGLQIIVCQSVFLCILSLCSFSFLCIMCFLNGTLSSCSLSLFFVHLINCLLHTKIQLCQNHLREICLDLFRNHLPWTPVVAQTLTFICISIHL